MTTPRLAIGMIASVLLSGCGRAPAAPPTAPPAKVTGAVPESALATLTLTDEAQKRLGIETTSIQRRGVAKARHFGGDIMPAGGAQTTVTAPMAGTLGADHAAPVVGSQVARGQVVLTLIPLAPGERDVRIEAERIVAEAVGRQEMTAKRAQRAQQLARDGSGSQRAAEEAQADLAVADAALKAARDRLALAARGVSASGAVRLEAPHRALLRTLLASPGQTVGAGTPLFELVAIDTVWLRVPIFAGDLESIDTRAAVDIVPLGSTAAAAGISAKPVAAPPTADPSTAGVDLFYTFANGEHAFRPGQRVSVRVPLRSNEDRLVVSKAAILFDAFGGTWVYEARDGGVFARQRVALIDIVGDAAVLDRGPAVGTRIVTAGAAELFGTEFGVGK